jgi:hypothetical protein
MSEKSVELLISGSITPPEMDNYEEDEEIRQRWGIYESSTYDILEQINKETFQDTYVILKSDITSFEPKFQVFFLQKYLEKMYEVYEFQFLQNPKFEDDDSVEQMFKFIEFVEFDNLHFLKYVWRYLDDIMDVNIPEYVHKNWKSVIEEITNQSNLLTTINENVSEFLRTYNKEGILEWFIDRSKRKKFDIFSENLE